MARGVREYKIKWKDYPDSANKWEPIMNLVCHEDSIADHEKTWQAEYEKKSLEEHTRRDALERQQNRLHCNPQHAIKTNRPNKLRTWVQTIPILIRAKVKVALRESMQGNLEVFSGIQMS